MKSLAGVVTGLVRLVGLASLVGLLGACTALDTWQRGKVYRPTAVNDPQVWQEMLTQRPDVSVLQVPVSTGQQVTVLHIPSAPVMPVMPGVPGASTPVKVLYLHGTLRHAYQNLAKIDGIARNGLDVVAPDYRGWGRSTPLLPDEASLHEDAWAVWQTLQAAAKSGDPAVRWVIYGHSMGSGVAVRLAQRIAQAQRQRGAAQPASGDVSGNPNLSGDYCALVLESAFTSFPDIAWDAAGALGPVAMALTTQKMASSERIGQVHGPLWMLHGSLDRTIPMALGRRLFELAPSPKHWLDLPLAHSDLQTDSSGAYDSVWQAVKASCLGSQATP